MVGMNLLVFLFLFNLMCSLLKSFTVAENHFARLCILHYTLYILHYLLQYTVPLKEKQLEMSIKSIVKKRIRKDKSEKARKKRKFAENLSFYGFECPHCPKDEGGDSEV